MRANSFAGQCESCKVKVEARAGFIFKRDNVWRCVCASVACHRSLGLETQGNGGKLCEDGTITMPYDSNALPLLRAMPRARGIQAFDRKRSVWTFSLDPADRPRVLELADRLGLEVPAVLRVFETSGPEREALQRAEAAGLYPFQLEGVTFLARRKRALLGDDMGLGKTVQTLVALPSSGSALVVCPNAMKFVWRDEIQKWRKDYTATVLPRGAKNFRRPSWNEIVITNYEGLPAEFEAEDFAKVFFILDEAHAGKNWKAQRSKKFAKLAEVCASTWLLTGTPLMNNPPDLFGVLGSGGMARDVFGSWSTFLRCFSAQPGQWGGYDFGDPDPSVPERLRRVMLRRLKKDVLPELPKKQYQTITVEAGRVVTLSADAMDRLVAGLLPDFSDMSRVRRELAEERIPAMLEIVKEHEDQNEPLLVFSAHRAPIDELEKRPGWAAIHGDTKPEDRSRIVAEFQSGALKGVGLTIAAGGVGLTLTRASRELFIDRDWTPALNLQAEDRAVRIGQKADSVLVMVMVSDDPIDRRVHELLEKKIELIQKAIENTVSFEQKKGAELVEESDETMQARRASFEAAEKLAVKAEAKERVREFHAKRVGPGLRKVFTPDQVPEIRRGIQALASVCDGAEMRDRQGFNKPDAYVGHWLAESGLEDQESLELAYTILRGYPRQLQQLGIAL